MIGVIRGHGGKAKYFIDKKEVSKEQFEAAFPDKQIGDGSGLIGWKPLVCNALAVHPDQVTEAIADAKQKGVPVDFLPSGEPVFRSRARYKEYAEAYGFFNRDGGYGDARRDAPR